MKACKTEENQNIFDFCEYCDKLSNLMVYNTSSSTKVWCEKCNKKSHKSKYKEKLFGVDIKKKRDEKARRKEQEYIDSMEMNEEDREDFECKICLCDVDLEDNLQCLFCSQTFCFECMVKWMSINQTCPYCERTITKSNIRPNKEKKLFLDRKIKENKKIKKPKCESHYKSCALYCVTCAAFICNKCIISKKHNNHEIIETKECIQKLIEKASFEINNERSALKRRKELISEAEFNINLNQKIFNYALDSSNQSLKNAGERFQMKIDCISKSKKEILCCDMKEHEEADNILKLFIYKKNPELLDKVSKSLKKNDNLEKENESSLDSFRKELINNKMIIRSCDKKIGFMLPLSKLSKGHHYSSNELSLKYKINIKKDQEKGTILIMIKLEEKDKSLWYCKIGMDENEYCYLKEQQIREIYSNEESTQINELLLKVDEKDINKNYQVTFYVYLLKADEKISNHIRDAEEDILLSMIKNFKDKYNIIENNSLSKNEEEAKIKLELGIKEDKQIKAEENLEENNENDDKEEENQCEDNEGNKLIKDKENGEEIRLKIKKILFQHKES